ncbi:cellulase family glycosylhydrolase [Neptunicella sp. SCSIO 80796]|uniref:cellulase family glycosylhydrolase n=1 Tax=Neptunicella plasticusilytica TaxID=3117012 RepID=UPI003A4D8918
MKLRLGYLPIILATMIMQGCGGDLLDKDADIDTLVPDPPVELPNRPSPPEDALVITTSSNEIYDASTDPVLLRGINLQYGDNPEVRLAGIAAIKQTGSNVVRLQLRANTSADQLRAALDEIVAQGMIAMPMLWEGEGEITCTESSEFIKKYTQELWFDKWIDVLVEAKYQPYLMINIANEWGPTGIWDANSVGYSEYIDTYKEIIREFREIGFRVPLVIDAPGCGQDYNAFLADRGLELLAADKETNLVLSVHAYHAQWNSSDKIVTATDAMSKTGVPFIVGEFGGSMVFGAASIDHTDLINKAVGDPSMIFNFPWTGGTDKSAYQYELPEALDLQGSNISTDVYVPVRYVEDGNLGVQMYLRDGSNRYAGLGFKQANDTDLKGNAWTTLSFAIESVSDFGGSVDEGFDLADVKKIGFEVSANGKPANIVGDIKFDNIKIEAGGAVPAMYQADFVGETQGWGKDWTAGTVVSSDADNLIVTQDWSASDQFAIFVGGANTGIDTSNPLTIKLKIFVPEEYASETGLYFKVYVNHGDSWTWGETSTAGLADLTPGEWTEVVFDNVDWTTFGNLQKFGIQFGGVSAGKSEPILIDSITVTDPNSTESAGDPPMYYPQFDTDTENWVKFWGGSSTITADAEGSLVITPDWVSEGKVGFGQAGVSSIDTSAPVSIKAKVFIPASYADESGFYLQVFVQDQGWGWFSVPQPNLTMADFTPGQWTEITIDNVDLSAQVTPFQRFGIEIGGVVMTENTDPILIDYVAVLADGQSLDAGGVMGLITQYEQDFIGELGGWERDPWEDSTGAISVDGSNLVLSQQWATKDQLGLYVAGGTASLDTSEPITLSARVFIPASYADATNLFFRFYMQHGEDWSGWNTSADKTLADFNLGDWTVITFENVDFTMVQTLQRLGVQVGGVGANKDEPILVDYIKVEKIGLVPLELETLFNMGFNDPADVDAWSLDYTDGGFNDEVLSEAKMHGYGIVPFGWMAWSWKGNGDDTAVLDMSTSEDSVELTTRGNEIVNGPNGIKSSSEPAGFGQ